MANKSPDITGLKKWPPRLSKDNQPTPEQKKAGRERKRQAKKILDHMMKMWSMTKQQRLEYVKQNPDELQMDELINIKYMEEIMKGKLLVDWMNRHIPYAPQKTELTGTDWWPMEMIDLTGKSAKELEALRKKFL